MAAGASNNSICRMESEFDVNGYDMSAVAGLSEAVAGLSKTAAGLSKIKPIIEDDELELPTGKVGDLWIVNPEKAKGRFLYSTFNRFAYFYSLNEYVGHGETEKSSDEHRLPEYVMNAKKWMKPYDEVVKQIGNEVLLSVASSDFSECRGQRVKDLMKDLCGAYDDLYESFEKAFKSKEKLIPVNVVRRCVTEYYRLVGKSVFFPENSNLQSVQFRNSDYLQQLVLPGYNKSGTPSHLFINPQHPELGFRIPFAEAFSLSVLLDMADSWADLAQTLTSSHSGVLHTLRLAQARTLADMSFGRFMYLNGESYRITLNRQTSEIVARPFYRRSSVTAVKPIRLFEKIKTFLCDLYRQQDKEDPCAESVECSIAVIGHSEKSHLYKSEDEKGKCGTEVEIADLCMALDGWIKERQQQRVVTKRMEVRLNWYVNVADWYTCTGLPRFDFDEDNNVFEEKIVRAEKDSPVVCKLIPVRYETQYAYNHDLMIQIVQESNMTFLLEPSFLFFEDYESDRDTSIDFYCRNLTKNAGGTPDITWKPRSEAFDSKIASMQFLGTQLNRIMASRSMTAGSVFRVINERYVDRIRETAEKKDGKRRTVFIFSTETTGLNMGHLAFHPLLRVEKYNQKAMSIIQFCNYPLPSVLNDWKLERAGGEALPADFDIPLWSLFKYQSIMYAFEEKDAWTKSLSDGVDCSWMKPYDYLRILKSVRIRLRARPTGRGAFGITASLEIKECLNCYLNSRLGVGREPEKESIRDALLTFYKPFVRELVEKFLFRSADADRGLELMQTGFSMNLFSTSFDIRNMFFLYLYDRARRTNTLEALVPKTPTWVDSLGGQRVGQCGIHEKFFMDKRLFLEIPTRLNSDGDLDLVGFTLCTEAGKLEWGENKEKLDYYSEMPRVLLDMCWWAGITDGTLYRGLMAWNKKV